MFDRFDADARQVVMTSCVVAGEDRSPLTEPHHLLLAVASVPSATSAALALVGADGPAVAQALAQRPGSPRLRADRRGAVPKIPFSEPTKQALAAAVASAGGRSATEVVTAHLLVGLLRTPTPEVHAVWAQLGVDELTRWAAVRVAQRRFARAVDLRLSVLGAHRVAASTGSTALDVHHLLGGIVLVASDAAAVLAGHGVGWNVAGPAVAAAPPSVAEPTTVPTPMALTSAATEAVDRAASWASHRGAAVPTAVHLAIGVLDEPTPAVLATLAAAGTDRPTVRGALDAVAGP